MRQGHGHSRRTRYVTLATELCDRPAEQALRRALRRAAPERLASHLLHRWKEERNGGEGRVAERHDSRCELNPTVADSFRCCGGPELDADARYENNLV